LWRLGGLALDRFRAHIWTMKKRIDWTPAAVAMGKKGGKARADSRPRKAEPLLLGKMIH
jgi:hypothetical protein